MKTIPYLWQRPESRVLWFRRMVPQHLREIVGKPSIRFSLKTTDPREAAALCRHHAAQLDREWGLAPTNPGMRPTIATIEQTAVEFGYELALAASDQRRREVADDHHAYGLHMRRQEINAQQYAYAAATGETSAVEPAMSAIIEAQGLNISPADPEYAQLATALAAAMSAAAITAGRRARGDASADTDAEIVQRVRAAKASKAKPGETIAELYEAWALDRAQIDGATAATIEDGRKIVNRFAEFVGTDRALDSITPTDAAQWRDTLRALPPKWMSKKELAGLDQRAAAAKATALGMATGSLVNINKQMSNVSPLYRWAAGQPRWAGLRNPFDGLFYQKVKGKNARPPYNSDQLTAIIHSLPDDGWLRWVPLIALATGMRTGEVCQLRAHDVRQDNGSWLIHVVHDPAQGMATKTKVSRFVPVSMLLEGLGFLDFVDRREGRLFPELERDQTGEYSKASRWFRDHLEEIGVKDGRDGLGLHSFRHTMADRLRVEAELLDSEVAVILGHSSTGVTAGYGAISQGSVNRLRGWIDAVRFDGVDFGKLID